MKIGTSERPKLNALTSLRFVAAALIVLHHSQGYFGIAPDAMSPFVLSQGVSFFFILSGFILTYVYPSLEKFGKRRFLIARFARVWPAHFVAFVLYLVIYPLNLLLRQNQAIERALAQIFLIHAWIPLQSYYYAYNGVSWSISVEFAFYLCFLFLIHDWQRTWKLKLVFSAILVGISIIIANSSPELSGMVYTHPLARLFEFTLGMVIALAWRRLSGRVAVRQMVGAAIELTALGLVIAAMYYSQPMADSLAQLPWLGHSGIVWMARSGVVCLEFALLIFVMALELGPISRLLSWSFFVFLGEISYSVYLIHKTLIEFYRINPKLFVSMPNWFAYLLFWVATLGIATLIWVSIERPCRRFIVGLWPKRSSISAPELTISHTS